MKYLGLTLWQWDVIVILLVVAIAIFSVVIFHNSRNKVQRYSLYKDLMGKIALSIRLIGIKSQVNKKDVR